MAPDNLPISPQSKAIGGRIKQAREAVGWTQKQLADAVETKEVSVSGWERGLYTPNKENFGRLARALQVAEPALRYGADVPSEPRSSRLSHRNTISGPKLPPRAYERVYGYLERMRKAGLPEEMIDESERVMTVPVFSKLNKRDIRERSEEDLVTDIDAAWTWIQEVVLREWGITL